MAIPKSANERIRRKLRAKKVGPNSTSMPGRITVKKTADNDPNRNRRKSEEFLRWYKGDNNVENTIRFKNLVENLISIATAAANEVEFPFSLTRLVELKENIEK